VGLRLPRRPVWQARLDALSTAAQTRLGEQAVLSAQTAGNAMGHTSAVALVQDLRQAMACRA
jgi:hypothetical protein